MPIATKQKRGVSKQSAFLAAYVRMASVTKAAKAAKIQRDMHYRWLAEDREYVRRFEAAKIEAAQILEDEAIRRAHEGILKPLTYKGQFSYKTRPRKDANGNVMKDKEGRVQMEEYGAPLAIREYSDGMMMFLLRGFMPGKYRENSTVELSGPGGGPLPVTDPRLAELSDEELEQLVRLSRKLEPDA